MPYIEITITAPEESRDAIIHKMAEMGATGFIEQGEKTIGYFDAIQSEPELCDELERFRSVLAASDLDATFSLSSTLLPEKDWNETWKKNFTPLDVGDNLVIIPSWLLSETGRIPIIIDPGMVFGTGHHETTRTCLALIERLSASGQKESFLDLGTGTGILAIAAARLGFRQVVAVDTDPLSIDAARRNAEANGLTNIDFCEGDISVVAGTFDCIAANLLSEILIDIAAALTERLSSGGLAILSGMLVGQEEGVMNAMKAAGLLLQKKITDDKWVSLIMAKQ